MSPADRETVAALRADDATPLDRLGRIVHEARLLALDAADARDARLRIAAGAIEGAARQQWQRLRSGT